MDSITTLLQNNERWASRLQAEDPEFFERMEEAQKPPFLWISCSDSRVPANQIVDLEPGQLFVHRNIANLVVHSDVNAQSVIQYAVDVLHVEHIIICGHYNCGGVKAALDNDTLGLLDHWLGNLRDIFEAHKEEISRINTEQGKVRRCCEINVKAQVFNVSQSPFVQKVWRDNRSLSIHGLIYDLHDGRLKDLGITINESISASDYLGK
jgi:carbonic anhydrase